jgi:hypothetical protein
MASEDVPKCLTEEEEYLHGGSDMTSSRRNYKKMCDCAEGLLGR